MAGWQQGMPQGMPPGNQRWPPQPPPQWQQPQSQWQPAQQQWHQPPPQRVPAGPLIGLTLWRLLIAGFGLTGFLLAASDFGGFGNAFPGLSQQASLFTAFVYFGLACYPFLTGLRRHEPRSPWLRGATTLLLLLVCGTYFTLLGGDLDEGWSLFEHLLTPLVVLIDWVAVGRNQRDCKPWHPPTWVVFPLLYLVYFNVADVELYNFPLSVGDDGFFGYFAGFLVGLVLVGYLLFGVAKLRTLAMAAAQPHPGPPQNQAWQQHPPQQYPYPQQQNWQPYQPPPAPGAGPPRG